MTSWRDIGIGLFVGAVIIGPLLWTSVGRKLAVAPIAKGAKVTEKQVDEWLKKGEEE